MAEETTGHPRYSAGDLQACVEHLFVAAGARAPHAATTARVLVRTSLRGVDTHGIARVLPYLEKIRSGEVNPDPVYQESVREGVLWFDGDGGLGQAVADAAVQAAVGRARSTAVVTTVIRRSGHLAALGQFALDAAEQGMVALLCQETPPLMAMPGSRGPSIGNNPIAFAAPVAGRAPLVFDMASSVVARGNLLQAIRDGQTEVPANWAIGPDGAPTVDPQAALKGAMQPIAGHKGLGLAMLVQVLAGSLSGSDSAASAVAHGATSSAGNVSAFLLVINPDRMIGRAAFDAHMSAWLSSYLDASGKGSRYPGQRAAQVELERTRNGIPVPPSVVKDLRTAGLLVGLPFNLTPIPG